MYRVSDLTGLVNAVRARANAAGTQTDMNDWRPLPPPATAEDIAEAESRLSFPLPAALRRVYSEVANGGFGPGWGLNRIIDTRSNAERTWSCVDHYLDARGDSEIKWQVGVLPVNDWGCGIYSAVDITQPHAPMLCVVTDLFHEPDPEDAARAITPLAGTFNEWLQAWVGGENLWDSMTAELENSQP